MSDITIEWLAGFYEGEGSPRNTRGFLQLTIAQKEREVLDTIKEVFGGEVHKYANGLHYWYKGAGASELALELLKYMHSPYKIEQLTKALILTEHLKPRDETEAEEIETSKTRNKTLTAQYHKKNEESIHLHHKNYREEHKEEQREQHRKNYEKAKAVRQYIRENPERVKELLSQ